MRKLLLAAPLLCLVSCATTGTLPLRASHQADTMLTAYTLPAQVGKLVVRGNVILQQGQGNSVVGKDKTGQRANGVSTGANSPVSASAKHSGPAWWVYALIGAVSIIAWEWLSHRAFNLSWLPTRQPAKIP